MTDDTKKLSASENILSTQRNFLGKAGLGARAALAAPAVIAQAGPIKWRLQTYSGARSAPTSSSRRSTPSMPPPMARW